MTIYRAIYSRSGHGSINVYRNDVLAGTVTPAMTYGMKFAFEVGQIMKKVAVPDVGYAFDKYCVDYPTNSKCATANPSSETFTSSSPVNGYHNYYFKLATVITSNIPFKRCIYVHEWATPEQPNGTLKDLATAKTTLDNCKYMNCDAVMMFVSSEYFEAVRDPTTKYPDGQTKSSGDPRAATNWLEQVIDYAHSIGIQVHVWIPVNNISADKLGTYWKRAERRLFGTQYAVIKRDCTTNKLSQTTRNDLVYPTLFNYELGLIKFIAGRYSKLDGIHIEEPMYPYTPSYSQGMRDQIKTKYGFDPYTKGCNEVIGNRSVRQIIAGEMMLVMDSFFTQARNIINTYKTNPSLQFSANGLYYYSDHTGFNPLSSGTIMKNKLLNWYAAQAYRGCNIYHILPASLSYKKSLLYPDKTVNDSCGNSAQGEGMYDFIALCNQFYNNVKPEITGIAIVPIIGIAFIMNRGCNPYKSCVSGEPCCPGTSTKPAQYQEDSLTNLISMNELKVVTANHGYAEAVFRYGQDNRTISGKYVRDWLHEILPKSKE